MNVLVTSCGDFQVHHQSNVIGNQEVVPEKENGKRRFQLPDLDFSPIPFFTLHHHHHSHLHLLHFLLTFPSKPSSLFTPLFTQISFLFSFLSCSFISQDINFGEKSIF
ncbi:hypothetical protein RIF29_17035 [Crotalaria pallida]|uniref:Uncharacterized protein n=1 Tax=Crotalaria pallida TaxID=3830 RepID=A0AAN9FGK8_CROPI